MPTPTPGDDKLPDDIFQGLHTLFRFFFLWVIYPNIHEFSIFEHSAHCLPNILTSIHASQYTQNDTQIVISLSIIYTPTFSLLSFSSLDLQTTAEIYLIRKPILFIHLYIHSGIYSLLTTRPPSRPLPCPSLFNDAASWISLLA
jgi:hypothetical protein